MADKEQQESDDVRPERFIDDTQDHITVVDADALDAIEARAKAAKDAEAETARRREIAAKLGV